MPQIFDSVMNWYCIHTMKLCSIKKKDEILPAESVILQQIITRRKISIKWANSYVMQNKEIENFLWKQMLRPWLNGGKEKDREKSYKQWWWRNNAYIDMVVLW